MYYRCSMYYWCSDCKEKIDIQKEKEDGIRTLLECPPHRARQKEKDIEWLARKGYYGLARLLSE